MGFLDNVVKSLPSISAKFQSHVARHIALRQTRAMGPAGWTMLWGAKPSTCNPYSLYSGGTAWSGGNSNMITSIFGDGASGDYNQYYGDYSSGIDAVLYAKDLGNQFISQIEQEFDPDKITISPSSSSDT